MAWLTTKSTVSHSVTVTVMSHTTDLWLSRFADSLLDISYKQIQMWGVTEVEELRKSSHFHLLSTAYCDNQTAHGRLTSSLFSLGATSKSDYRLGIIAVFGFIFMSLFHDFGSCIYIEQTRQTDSHRPQSGRKFLPVDYHTLMALFTLLLQRK